MARRPLKPEERKRASRTLFEKDWEERHAKARCRGLHWKDMPGNEMETKKLNWALWRKGLYDENYLAEAPKKWVVRMDSVGRARMAELSRARMAAMADGCECGED